MMSTLAIAIIAAAAVSLIGVGVIVEIISRQQQAAGSAEAPAGSVMFHTNWLPLLFILALGIGVIGFAVYLRERAGEVADTYGDDIASLCKNATLSSADERNLKTRLRPFRLLVLTLEGHRHPWHTRLPDDLSATNRASIDLVACVGDRLYSEVVESCEYVDHISGSVYDVERIRYYKNVYLLNPDTGQVAKILRAWGSAPEYCPDQIQSGRRSLTGGEPDYVYFHEVLIDYAG